jgi:hypothetical protein
MIWKPGATWTEEQDQELIRLERQGFSAYLIAERMGKSRSAVIGRSFRLRGDQPRTSPPIIRKVPVCSPRSKSKPLPNLAKAAAIGRMVEIFELTDGMCRWPHGDHSPYLFCAAPVAFLDNSYCALHFRLSHKGVHER